MLHCYVRPKVFAEWLSNVVEIQAFYDKLKQIVYTLRVDRYNMHRLKDGVYVHPYGRPINPEFGFQLRISTETRSHFFLTITVAFDVLATRHKRSADVGF
jgi:hypothetical protein